MARQGLIRSHGAVENPAGTFVPRCGRGRFHPPAHLRVTPTATPAHSVPRRTTRQTRQGSSSTGPCMWRLAEEMTVKRIRTQRPRARRERPWREVLPPGPRDPDVVWAKALARGDPSGVHYARVARACGAGLISRVDFGEAIHDDVITGADVLRRPGSRRVTVYDSFPADCSPSWRAACVPPPPGPEPGRLLPARTCLEGIRPPAGDDGSGTA